MADQQRADLFRYLTADESEDYLAILDLFTGTLLADLSAAEVVEQLAQPGIDLERDTVEARCRQLLAWGNLVPSIRDARVTTVADYLRSRSRYQVSKLGGRLHREARAILVATEGAREVARELLGRIAEALDRVLFAIADPSRPPDPEVLAGEVTSIFNDQHLFVESARDFYAYLSGVLRRYDLGDDEYTQFKGLLLDYVDLINADVNRHAPAVAERVDRVLALIDPLLDSLNQLPGLALEDVERSRGRSRTDWEELADWYGARGAGSGPEQLRGAASQALGQLLANAKRLLDTSGTGYSRRADLLRLATWFDGADDLESHRIYAAAYLNYPSRHLLAGPEEIDPRVGPATSWWHADPVDVAVSLRERGDRTIRGRSARVPDPRKDRVHLADDARREAEARGTVAAELLAVRDLDGAHISRAGRDLVLEQLSDLLARERTTVVDTDLGLRLTALPGSNTTIGSDDGSLVVEGLHLTVSASEAAAKAGEWAAGQ